MRSRSKYKTDILEMKPVRDFIFDCHCHIGAVGTFQVSSDGSMESLIRMMDIVGIDKAAFSHLLALQGDAVEGNRLGYESVSKFKDRAYQYVVYDPNLDEKEMLDSVNEFIDKPATIGVKLHPFWHGTSPDDKRYNPIMEYASRRAMPVLIHTWGIGEVLAAGRLAGRFPKSCILIGHSGGSDHKAINEAIKVAAENENAYLDLTMGRTYDGLVEYMLSRVPADKILFGSDMSFIDPRSLVGRLAFAKICDKDKEKIFGMNFLKMVSGVKRI